MYCYGIYQPLFDEIKRVIPAILFHEGLPDKEEMMELSRDGHALLILDDLMQEVSNSKARPVLPIFSPYGHQCDVFNAKSISTREIFTYDCFEYSCSGAVKIYEKCIPNQLLCSTVVSKSQGNVGGNLCGFHPYGYLVVDMNPSSADLYRLRTHIFPEEYPPVIYIPKKV